VRLKLGLIRPQDGEETMVEAEGPSMAMEALRFEWEGETEGKLEGFEGEGGKRCSTTP
jgi:hypothetical protein